MKLNTFTYDIEPHFSCKYDYLKIYDGKNSGDNTSETLCGSGNQDTIYSTGNTLFLTFKSDESTTKRGFQINYEVIGKYY